VPSALDNRVDTTLVPRNTTRVSPCKVWSGRGDLNARPPAPKASERVPFPVGITHILKALRTIVYGESRAL